VAQWARNVIGPVHAQKLLKQEYDGQALIILATSPYVFEHLKDLDIPQGQALKLWHAVLALNLPKNALQHESSDLELKDVELHPEQVHSVQTRPSFTQNIGQHQCLPVGNTASGMGLNIYLPQINVRKTGKPIPQTLSSEEEEEEEVEIVMENKKRDVLTFHDAKLTRQKKNSKRSKKRKARETLQIERKESNFIEKGSYHVEPVVGPSSIAVGSPVTNLPSKIRDATLWEDKYFRSKKIVSLKQLREGTRRS